MTQKTIEQSRKTLLDSIKDAHERVSLYKLLDELNY
jgi:hypothetical protein